jgi:hypothetical protein
MLSLAGKPIPIHAVNFKATYRAFLNHRLKEFNFSSKTSGPIVAFQGATGKKVGSRRI